MKISSKNHVKALRNSVLGEFYRFIRRTLPQIFIYSYLAKKYRKMMHDSLLVKYKESISINSKLLEKNKFQEVFFHHQGRKSQKWNHYLPVYDEVVDYLVERFGKNIKILEIGVQNGGSIQIWRQIFGPTASIWGIDIDPRCAEMELDAEIRIGSSADRNFLKKISNEAGYFDLIIDDGSHHSKHQRIALECLFPYLSNDGYYVIEDIEHSYYWSKAGGYLRPGSIIENSKRLVDYLNTDFFIFPKLSSFKIDTKSVLSVTFLQGMVIIKKRQKIQPNIVWSGIVDDVR